MYFLHIRSFAEYDIIQYNNVIDEAETQIAFEKHFGEELALYGPICIVNLVEQSGKEKIIWEAYSNHVFNYNHSDITYTTFDFHEYW